MENCVNSGDVEASSNNADHAVGGIIGYCGGSTSCTINKCANIKPKDGGGTISASNDNGKLAVGGIGGLFNYASTIKNCYNSGTISGSKAYAMGGIAGRIKSSTTFANCYNGGDFSGSTYSTGHGVGGILGHTRVTANINNCYNSGTFTALTSSTYYGILCAYTATSNLYNCYCQSGITISGKTAAVSSGTSSPTINKYRCEVFTSTAGADQGNLDNPVTVNTLNVSDAGSNEYTTLKGALDAWVTKNSAGGYSTWGTGPIPTF